MEEKDDDYEVDSEAAGQCGSSPDPRGIRGVYAVMRVHAYPTARQQSHYVYLLQVFLALLRPPTPVSPTTSRSVFARKETQKNFVTHIGADSPRERQLRNQLWFRRGMGHDELYP